MWDKRREEDVWCVCVCENRSFKVTSYMAGCAYQCKDNGQNRRIEIAIGRGHITIGVAMNEHKSEL